MKLELKKTQGIALAQFHSLYWMIEANIYFPKFCILYKKKNGQYLSIKLGPLFGTN